MESKWNFDVHKVYFLGHDLILIDDSSILYVVGLMLIVQLEVNTMDLRILDNCLRIIKFNDKQNQEKLLKEVKSWRLRIRLGQALTLSD